MIIKVFSLILWFTAQYYYFASCLLFISVVMVIQSLYETKKNYSSIQQQASYTCKVRVMRHGPMEALTEITSDGLVPGDIIEIPDQCIIPCDVVLMKGIAVMNESMLTGESIPSIKTAIPCTDDVYNMQADAKYTLYGGTKVVQTRKIGDSYVLGLVVRTGFQTTKGGLIRDILYPRPSRFSFWRDSLIYIGMFFAITIIGFGFSVPAMKEQDYEDSDIVKRALDLVTISVPPTLPAAMTIGTSYALSRLKAKKIFCISPPRINVSGKVTCFVLDKTGTLTEDGLQVYGYRGCKKTNAGSHHVEFDNFHDDIENLQHEGSFWKNKSDYERHKDNLTIKLVESMATCH